MAYVEFFQPESVKIALGLNNKPFSMDGKDLRYSEIKVQPSYAEKNRAAQAARQIKQQKLQSMQQQLLLLSQAPMRIYVGGLIENLKDITDEELKKVFSAFGEVERVDIHKDLQTGFCKGFAFVTYKKADDARAAIKEMNNQLIKGTKIMVSTVPPQQQAPIVHHPPPIQPEQITDLDISEDSGSAYLHNSSARLQLMKKLGGNDFGGTGVNLLQPMPRGAGQPIPGTNINAGPLPSQNPLLLLQQIPMQNMPPQASTLPTRCIVIRNLFTEEETKGEETFFTDLLEEIEEECKRYGLIEQIYIDTKTPKLGMVIIRFADIKQAIECQKVMNNRYFDNKQILSYHITEACFMQEMQRLAMH